MTSRNDFLLIDGHCGMCSRLGAFLTKRLSKSAKLQIVAQDEDEGINLISELPNKIQQIDSVILIRNNVVYYYSSAGIRCLLYLKWWWKMWYPFVWIVPLPIRDVVYKIVSKNRKRFFKN